MLLLAKFAAVAIVVWFYLTAQQHQQPPIKWAIIGFIGYVLAWFLVYETFIVVLPPSMTRSQGMGFIVMQIPALCAIVAAYLVRKKLVYDAVNNPTSLPSETE
jgi:RsiW-degrading membrane proteinase PrsW (M82 family)